MGHHRRVQLLALFLVALPAALHPVPCCTPPRCVLHSALAVGALLTTYEDMKEKHAALMAKVFDKDRCSAIYQGYVDETSNTDNAWVEAKVLHFHCPDDLADQVYLAEGKTIEKARWVNIRDGDDSGYYADLNENHK